MTCHCDELREDLATAALERDIAESDAVQLRRALHYVVATEAHKVQSTRVRGPLWARIRDLVCLGSTSSAELCRELGFDPDTGAALAKGDA